MGRGVDLLALPLARFLNVIYHALLSRLKHDDKNPSAPRDNFDKKLSVPQWTLPGGVYVPEKTEGRPPAWWDGDEEASQSFLQTMMVTHG